MLEHNLRGAEKGSLLLDLAARDDFGAFRHAVKEEGHDPDAFSIWYGRQGGSDHLLVDQRTPAMVASEHGSVNVLSFLLSSGLVDVNKRSRAGSRTALHFCAAGASQRAAEACSLLLRAGADRCIEDACGRRPADEIVSDYPQVSCAAVLMRAKRARWTTSMRHFFSNDCCCANCRSMYSSSMVPLSCSPPTSTF